MPGPADLAETLRVAEAVRRADLRRMKRVATGLFLAVAAVFVAARAVEARAADVPGWIGYVRATAEAAMVGALADWFAVTALFRRPLGLPIPHTAIIPERKNQIGEGLGEFVQTNFASGELLGERVEALRPAHRLGEWLARPDSPDALGRAIAGGLRWSMGRLRDDEVEAALQRVLEEQVQRIDVAPLLGRALGTATAEDRHQDVVAEGLRTMVRLLDASRGDLWQLFESSAPWWVPGKVDSSIFDRLFFAGRNLLAEAANDRHHPLRRRLDRRVAKLADELQHDEQLGARIASWRDDLLKDPAVRAWVASMWGDAKRRFLAQADDPSSPLRRRVDALVAQGSQHLRDDPALQRRIDEWVVRAVRNLADEHGHEVATLVSSTVARWDADDTASRIELQVGRDLQFIRINGTVVGGLAGLVIYALSRLL